MALIDVFERFNLQAAYELIDDISIISEEHKAFYKHMLRSRYELLLKDTYERLVE